MVKDEQKIEVQYGPVNKPRKPTSLNTGSKLIKEKLCAASWWKV